MSHKISVMILCLLALLFVCGATGGCGEVRYDVVWYQSPNWTPEGLIYAIKTVEHKREYGGGYHETLSTDYYYVTMDTNGNNETALPYNKYPYFSPLGTYAAFISGETISIVRRADDVEVYNFSIPTDNISWLSWGPDEDKLAYLNASSNDSGGIVSINIDGSGLTEVVSSGAVKPSWIYNDKIVFLNKVETTYFLALVNSDGTSLEVTDLSNTNVGTYPQYYSDGNFILTVGNSTFNKIQTSTAFVSSEVTHTLSSLSPKIWINPKLSPNGQKVVGGYSLENGIWIIDIDGSNLTELK